MRAARRGTAMGSGFAGRPWRLAVAAALLVLWQLAVAQADPTLARARALVDTGQAQAAYQLLFPELGRRAGDPTFDYLFALAALDSGHVSQAVFALERVLAVSPDQPQARAELARAYMELGELDNARMEFEAVKRMDPPAQVQATIDRYLAEIERRQGGPQGTQLRGYVSLTVGHDSNVNSAQDARALNVPLLAALSPTGDGTVQISNAGVSQSDHFAQVAAGGSVFHRLGPQLALVANAALAQRWNGSERRFDTGDARGDLGVTWQRDRDVFTLAAQASRFLLDRDAFRDAYGLFGQWRRDLGKATSGAAYAQVTALTYPDQRIRNANRYTVGGVLSHAPGGRFAPRVSLGLYGGVEDERASNVEHLGHRFIAVTGTAQLQLSSQVSAFLSASVEDRDYGGTDPFFLVEREDTFYRFGGGISYEFFKHWNLVPQLSYSRNDSNVGLNEYDRLLVSVTLRRGLQ